MKVHRKVITNYWLERFLVLVLSIIVTGCSSMKRQSDSFGCVSKIELELSKKLRLSHDFDGTYTYWLQIDKKQVKDLERKQSDLKRVEIFKSIEQVILPILDTCKLSSSRIKIVIDIDSDSLVKVIGG